jgi:uracil phosphoribosyltransferase
MSGSVTIVSHPLVNAKLSVLRKTETTPKEFREVCTSGVCFTFPSEILCLKSINYAQGIRQISMVLGIEASRDLPMEEFQGVSASIAIKVSADSEMNTLDSKPQLHHLLEPLSSLG